MNGELSQWRWIGFSEDDAKILAALAAIVSQRVGDNAFNLHFGSSTNKLAATESEPPGIMRGAPDTDSRIGNNLYSHICVAGKTVLRAGAQIHLVVATGNTQRLR